MTFTPLHRDLIAEMTAAELAEYERILAAELADLDEEGPALVGDVDPDDLPDTPGALAAALTGGLEVQRPHLDLIDEVLTAAVEKGGQRILLNIGPRYGKTRRVRWGCARLLAVRPDARIIYATYGKRLADEQTRWVRDLLETHDLGVRPRADTRAADRWWIDGAEGGMLAAGIGGGITGFGADLLVVDDVVKDAEEAESVGWRDKVWRWFTQTAWDRLEPNASVVVVMTRWHADDLTGRLLANQPGVWTHIRIPTVAEADDPVGRKPGELLWPERYDEQAVAAQQATLGTVAFTARHQQNPEISSGGIFDEAWIETNRRLIGNLPPFVTSVTVVDPSGSDKDTAAECGIVTMALGLDGDVYVLDDTSKRTTPAQWGAIAVRTAFQYGCQRILVEDNYGGQQTEFVVRTALRDHVRGEARLLHGPRGPEVERVNAKGSKLARAKPVAALYEGGRVHHVDDGSGTNKLEQLEQQIIPWEGEDDPSPDRLDALVHGVRALLMPAQTSGSQVQVQPRWAGMRPR